MSPTTPPAWPNAFLNAGDKLDVVNRTRQHTERPLRFFIWPVSTGSVSDDSPFFCSSGAPALARGHSLFRGSASGGLRHPPTLPRVQSRRHGAVVLVVTPNNNSRHRLCGHEASQLTARRVLPRVPLRHGTDAHWGMRHVQVLRLQMCVRGTATGTLCKFSVAYFVNAPDLALWGWGSGLFGASSVGTVNCPHATHPRSHLKYCRDAKGSYWVGTRKDSAHRRWTVTLRTRGSEKMKAQKGTAPPIN